MESQKDNMDPTTWYLDTTLVFLFFISAEFATVFQWTWTRIGFEHLVPKKPMLTKFCEISKINIFDNKISPNKNQFEFLSEV